jgi:hypothetical protein
MERACLPNPRLTDPKPFEDIELGHLNPQQTSNSAVNFPGYNDSEPGAPHDPNHHIPIEDLPPRPVRQARDWKVLITKVPLSAFRTIASAVADFVKNHATASQRVHLFALYSIIGMLIILLGVTVSKLGPPEIIINNPGVCSNCSNISTKTGSNIAIANLTTTSSHSSRQITTILVVPTITSHVVKTATINHTATEVQVTVVAGSGLSSSAAPSENGGARQLTSIVTVTPPGPTVTSIVLSTTEVAPTQAAVTRTDVVTASPGKRSAGRALEAASYGEAFYREYWNSLAAIVRSPLKDKLVPEGVVAVVAETEIQHVTFKTTKRLTRKETASKTDTKT